MRKLEGAPDIILLDVNMPSMDGFEVCRRIREFVSCPILFLTARTFEGDKVKGFSVGGDDYVVKPFSLMELEARVQAHLRREARHQNQAKVKFSGELLVDYSERAVYVNGYGVGLVKRNLILWNCYLKMPVRFLIKKEFMKRFGDMTAKGIAVSLPNISAGYAPKSER